MTNLTTKINQLQGQHCLKLIDISAGVIITRKIINNKVKFQTENNFSPKHYLDLQNFIRRKYSVLLNLNFYPDQDLKFLYSSPSHAFKASSYKEELYLISIGEYFIQGIDYFLPVKTLSGTFELDFDENSNYLVICHNNSREIIREEIFYCEEYTILKEANEEATFGNFLQLLKDETINSESLLISYLAKIGVPLKIQNKYLEFWDYLQQYLNTIDNIVYSSKRNEKVFNTIFHNIDLDDRQIHTKLVKHFKYDLEKAQNVLDYFLK